ncbi:MAG: ATP-binding cassette domain-containing protein [Bdellovibrionales bacterium]|nr:ATP-binding cassette domain-containing protein [Bdellovibrionales bacterium]
MFLGNFDKLFDMDMSWTRLWPIAKRYKGTIILALALGVALGQFSVLLPILAQLIIASFEKKALLDIPVVQKFVKHMDIDTTIAIFQWSHEDIALYVALCFPIYYLVYGILRYYHFYLVKFVGEKVISDIRVLLMEKFMDMDVMYLGRQEKGSGGMLSRILNDTLVLQQGLQFYADLIREPLIGLFLIGYMFYLNWQITLAAFIFLPVFMGVIRYVSKSLRKFGHQSQESLEEVTKTLKEGMDGVRVIQSFNLQERVKNKFSEQVDHYLNKRKKIIKREELGSPINEWFASVLVCGICLFMAQQIWTGQADVGGFIAFLVAAGMLDKPVKKSQQAIIRVQQNIVSLERLGEILDSHSAVQEPEQPQEFPEEWQEIEFQGVTFSYEDMPVLKNINLTIKRGEVVAFVGASGSGKSTLVGLIQRFFDPQQGTILIGGVDIKKLRTSDLRRHIGYVTQDVFLFDDTVENNIWFGDTRRDKSEVVAAAEVANAKGFIDQTPGGFQAKVGERGGKFSGGEKQRLSIARAVFKNPPILVLDEATSALDSASEQEVQKGIQSLIKGRTAMVIAHRLSTIMNSDRILVMKGGQIVEEGDHRSLLAQQGEYAHFYSLQAPAGV